MLRAEFVLTPRTQDLARKSLLIICGDETGLGGVGFFVEPHLAVTADHSLDEGVEPRRDRGTPPYLVDVMFHGAKEHGVRGLMEVVYRDSASDVAVLATVEGAPGHRHNLSCLGYNPVCIFLPY